MTIILITVTIMMIMIVMITEKKKKTPTRKIKKSIEHDKWVKINRKIYEGKEKYWKRKKKLLNINKEEKKIEEAELAVTNTGKGDKME